MARKHRAAAFTLIELLVVIGVIALLLSILLPSLNRARRKAQSVACASNMRQLHAAMTMFAGDNNGHLPRPYGVGELSSDPSSRSFNAVLQWAPDGVGHIDYSDDSAQLWKYLRGSETRKQVLMCPGDDAQPLGGYVENPRFPRNFSYSLNPLIRRDDPNGRQRLGLKLQRVRQPTTKIMIYEEFAPNDFLCLVALGATGDDAPSGRHALQMNDAYRNNPAAPGYASLGRGNFVFFDGHVESLAPVDLVRSTGKASYHMPLAADDPTTFQLATQVCCQLLGTCPPTPPE
jgi:prepilin-type processing-associated H-X9-DG protein/prepilin-type N-terminal cleavage/methylation domain-containing protein